MTLSTLSRLTALMLASFSVNMLCTMSAHADIVQATYEIIVSDFLNSNNGSPPPPTSNQLSGTVTFTYNTEISQMFEIVPDAVTGFTMTDAEGSIINYTAQNTGINTFNNAFSGDHRITFGGLPSVAFMVGISEDMRIRFDISPVTYEVTAIDEGFIYVTLVNAFYTAQNNSVELLSVNVLPDSDSDGIEDAADNCLSTANANQRDTDGDSIGNACDPDFNQDCLVNFIDLSTMAGNFLTQGDLDTDLNGDGVTNFVDLNILTGLFFMPPGPSGLVGVCVP